MVKLVTDKQIYQQVIMDMVCKARTFVWIATADLKDLYVDKAGRKVPFLEVLSNLAALNVELRMLHSKEPGPVFRRDFDRYPSLISKMERILCPRVHMKTVIVDAEKAYAGSANLTGAGMGAKSADRRNFEAGIITDVQEIVCQIMEKFDNIWMGAYCRKCKRKQFCADYKDMLVES